MGAAASVVSSEAAARLQENSADENTKALCALLDAAHGSGVDMAAVQSHIGKLIENDKKSWPWIWGTAAAAAVDSDFRSAEGFSHRELCIYKRNEGSAPEIDDRFKSELDFVLSSFYREQSEQAHPLEIVEITAIHNDNLLESMASSTLKIHEQIALGGAYGAHWMSGGDDGIIGPKRELLDVMGLSDPKACILGFAGQSNPQLCKNICSNGFADLAKTDPGYFGRGVYLSTHSEYAALYACSKWGWKGDNGSWQGVDIKGSINDIRPGEECTLLAAFATPGVCYPITRNTDYTKSFSWCDLKGQGMKFGYHSHAVLVNRLRVLREMNYQAMNVDADAHNAYGELVVQQTGQALPRYILRCRRKDDKSIVDTCRALFVESKSGDGLIRADEPDIFPNLHKDLQALVQFFEDTNGLNWKINTNWVQNTDFSTWQGPHYPVGLSANGGVDRLRLPSNNLCGVFSSSIGNLDMLRILDLSENKLCGDIPSEIGKLCNLEEIYIDKNGLSGVMPMLLVLRKSRIGRQCRVGGQRPLNGEISVGFTLSTDWGMVDSDSQDYIRSGGSTLGEVTKLLLADSSVVGPLPSVMLEYFSSSPCTPDSDRHSSELIELDISTNSLTGIIPPALGSIQSLQLVNLSNNKLSGEIPNDLVNLGCLKNINLSRNCLSGDFPIILSALTTLKNLDLSNNNLSGGIPDVFENLTGLLRLELGYNKFSGALPQSVSCLNSLILLSCEKNTLGGSIPADYGALSCLRGLNLSGNSLEGGFPSEIAALTSLQRLDISNNKISDNLPVFAAHQKLRIINVSQNRFSGDVPEEWNLLSTLETVFLNDNPELNITGCSSILGPRVELTA